MSLPQRNPEDFPDSNKSSYSLDCSKLTFDNAGGDTQTELRFYEKYTHTTRYIGVFTSSNQSVLLERVGNLVTMRIPSVIMNASSASSLNFETVLPSRFRPACSGVTYIMQIAHIRDNGSNNIGLMKISDDGNVNIYTGANSNNFSGLAILGTSGIYNLTVSYIAT